MKRVLAVLCSRRGRHGEAGRRAGPATPSQPPVLTELRLEGATVYKRDDVLWLLRLREGAPLPGQPDGVAKALQERYERDGYSEARVTGAFDGGRLTLTVDEGRIDEIEILGVRGAGRGALPAAARHRAGRHLQHARHRPGDGAADRGQPAARCRSARRAGSQPASERGRIRAGRGRPRAARHAQRPRRPAALEAGPSTDRALGSGREDLFSPADGLHPRVGFSTTIFDHRNFNHTFSTATWRTSSAATIPGIPPASSGRCSAVRRSCFSAAKSTTSPPRDDLWRLSTFEQALVSLGFKNSFRDYYRRRGGQVFGVAARRRAQRAERDGALGPPRAAAPTRRPIRSSATTRRSARRCRSSTSTSTRSCSATRSIRVR